MRFLSEQARLEHPQAGLIPQPIWRYVDFFNYELSDYQLRLMQNPSDEIARLLALDDTTFFEEFQTDSERWTAWLALACAKPRVSSQDLLILAEQLQFSNQDIFFLATQVDRADYLEYWSQYMAQTDEGNTEFQLMIKASEYRAFRYAAKHGHLDVVKYFLGIDGVDLDAMISAREYGAFRFAAKYGYHHVVEYFLSRDGADVEALISAHDDYAFRFAAKHGHLDVVKCLVDQAGTHIETMLSARDYSAFYMAAEKGHDEITHYLLEFPNVRARVMNDPLQQIMAALDALDPYAAGAVGHEAIDEVKVKIQALHQDMNIKEWFDSLGAIEDQILNLHFQQDIYFEGASPEHFRNVTDVLRYMCSGMTALLSCFGVPQDRNLLAERILNRPFFFKRTETQDDLNDIYQQLNIACQNIDWAITQLPRPAEYRFENEGPQF
jgi:hypothetical protein